MKRQAWVEHLFRPLVIGVMAGCVAWSLSQLVLVFAPAWNPTYLVAGCVLVAWEAAYSYRLLRSRRIGGYNALSFRLVELSMIFLLLKAARYIGTSLSDVVAEVRNWPYDVSLVFDGETLTAFMLTLLCWDAATQTLGDLDRIGAPPDERAGRAAPIARLTRRYFGGGVVLLIAIGLVRIGGASELLNLRRPSIRGMMANVLIYFFLGLVMLGQVRFVELRRGWRGQGAQVADQVAGRWVRYSLSLIALAALLAVMLPTEFALGPLNSLASALGMITAILFKVVSMIAAILLFPLALLLWLVSALFSEGEQQPPPQPKLPAFEPPQISGGGGATSWLEIARVLLFWAAALGGIFYVVRSYLRDHPELQKVLLRLRPLQGLHRAWVSFWRWLRGEIARLGQTVSERLPRRAPSWAPTNGARVQSLRYLRLGALSPRERVLYYFLSVLRRAGRQGYPRQQHQTPEEYQAMLSHELSQAEEDLTSLTQAFVEARYSQHKVGPDRDQVARANWKRVKAALRALGQQPEQKE